MAEEDQEPPLYIRITCNGKLIDGIKSFPDTIVNALHVHVEVQQILLFFLNNTGVTEHLCHLWCIRIQIHP